LARAGYTGSQSLSAFWAGDSSTSEWGLRQAIIAAQRAAVMGFSLWGADIGGYGIRLDREVLARWIAFGAFTPIMQVGPTENRSLWDMRPNRGTTPSSSPLAPVREAPHRSAELQRRARTDRTRHGRADDPAALSCLPCDRRAWETWKNFSTATTSSSARSAEGQRAMSVYLPEGDWLDVWNPTRLVSGPITVTIDCPMYKIPIFIRPRAATARAMGDLNALWDDSLKRARAKPDLAALAAATTRTCLINPNQSRDHESTKPRKRKP